jgi:hypothetical protein
MLDAKDDGATISAAMAKRFTTDHCFKSEEPRTVAARAPAHKIPAVANPSPAVANATDGELRAFDGSLGLSDCQQLRAVACSHGPVTSLPTAAAQSDGERDRNRIR